MTEHIGRVHGVAVERVEEGRAVGLLVDAGGVVDRKAVARRVKRRHVQAEEAGELPFMTEGQFSHARMHAIGADDKREVVFAAVGKAHMHGVAALFQGLERAGVAHFDTDFVAALGEDVLEILPAQIDVAVVERAPQPFDRHVHEGGAVGRDEVERLDRIAHRAQVIDETHALGDVPAGAEEVHHVAFGAQARLALDHQRREAVTLEFDGKRQARNTAAGDEDAGRAHGDPSERTRRVSIFGAVEFLQAPMLKRVPAASARPKTPLPATWRRRGSARRRGWT